MGMDTTRDFWYNIRMLRVEIEIPHPVETLFLLLAAGGVWMWMAWDLPQGSKTQAAVTSVHPASVGQDAAEEPSSFGESGAGGSDRQARVLALKSAEDDARRIRTEQAVLARREEILRYQLKILEDAGSRLGDTASVRTAKENLRALLADQRMAEERFRETLHEMWEAEGLSLAVAVGSAGNVRVLWPVEPDEGLSATFLDEGYQQRFGIPHHAIDIPVPQGSAIRSAADGVVDTVMDSGLGYSYILVKHDGFVTLYGHVSAFFVREGDQVRQGDVLGASGGMPGTSGAGTLTTGPHLHFEVMVNGERVDPVAVLPGRPLVPRT